MLSVGSTAIGSEAADKPLQITVQIGYHNTVKLGQWMPVVVDLTNAGPALDGTLEVQANNTTPSNGGPPIGQVVYQTPISLATGASKHVRTYVTQEFPGAVSVRVVQQGRVMRAGEMASPEPAYRALHPAQQMNAVGDVADGHLLDGFVRVQAIPHVPADPSVQLAYAVGRAR